MESSKVLCQSLIKNLANTLKIPVHLFDTKGQLLLSHSNLNEKTNPLLTDHKLFLEILEKSASGEIELYFDGLIFYVALLKDDFIIIAGPILRSDETLSDKVILSAKKHVATPAPLARGKLEQVVNAMCLVYSALNGRECSAEKIMQFAFENLDNNLLDDEISKQISNVLSKQLMLSRPHNDESYERKIREAIMAGDRERLRLAIDCDFDGERGVIAFTPLRNAQNLAIVDVTISSRAAIDAGLNAENIYTIGDGMILEIEQCQSASKAQAIARFAAFKFCEMVRFNQEQEQASRHNPISRSIEEYVKRNLNQDINLKTLAKTLDFDPTYLQKAFKKQMGCTIREAILRWRVEAAQLLLEDNSYSILEISKITGFKTQAHFSRIFKHLIGVNPSKYRQLPPEDLKVNVFKKWGIRK